MWVKIDAEDSSAKARGVCAFRLQGTRITRVASYPVAERQGEREEEEEEEDLVAGQSTSWRFAGRQQKYRRCARLKAGHRRLTGMLSATWLRNYVIM